MPGLTAKQEKFAVAVAKGATAADAYRAAYDTSRMKDKSVHELSCKLAKNAKVASRIEQLKAPALRRAELSVERTLREVARLAYFDPRSLFREDGSVKRPDEWDDDTAAAVAGIEVVEEFEGRGEDRKLTGYLKRYKLWDKNAALEKAMKHLGMFREDNAQKRESLAIQVNLVGPAEPPPAPREAIVSATLVGVGKNGNGER